MVPTEQNHTNIQENLLHTSPYTLSLWAQKIQAMCWDEQFHSTKALRTSSSPPLGSEQKHLRQARPPRLLKSMPMSNSVEPASLAAAARHKSLRSNRSVKKASGSGSGPPIQTRIAFIALRRSHKNRLFESCPCMPARLRACAPMCKNSF